MAALPSRAPQRRLMGRLRDLLGIGQPGGPDAQEEQRAAIERAQRQRERARQVTAAWDRVEAETQQRGHLAWEDLIGPPTAECREADRWN